MRRASFAMRTAGVLMIGLLAGCGGGGGGNPSGPTTTPPPARTRTVLGTFGFQLVGIPEANRVGLAFDFGGPIEVTISPTGDMDAVVDWTFASNPVHLYLTANTCTATQFSTASCSIQRSTEGSSAKPRTLTAPGLNGNYRVWVVNFGSSSESGTVQVGVTR